MYNEENTSSEATKSLFKVNFSDTETKAAFEEDIYFNFMNFIGHNRVEAVQCFTLQNVENGEVSECSKSAVKITLPDVLIFLTGSCILPSDDMQIKVLFDHYVDGRIKVGTCELEVMFQLSLGIPVQPFRNICLKT